MLCCFKALLACATSRATIKVPSDLCCERFWHKLLGGCITFHKRVGNPDTEAAFLHARSPLFKADQITIPVLIAQGANDPRVKQAESEQIVAAMQRHGIPYEYLLFPDEGHGFAKPENRLTFYATAEKFLATHLGGRYEA